jgi:hypothetical protein
MEAGEEGGFLDDSLGSGGAGGGAGEGAGAGEVQESAPGGGQPAGPRQLFDAASEDVLLSIPAFANAANRALHEKVLQRYRQLSRATAETRENQERARVMAEHLKHIHAELASAQRVAEAKSKDLRTEEHLSAMAERALGRARQDVSTNDGRLADARQQAAMLQAQIDRGTEKLERFRTTMSWKKDELERWTNAARQREADMQALDECV